LLANPIPGPQWADFEPARPIALGRMLGAGQRYQVSREEAERAFAAVQADWQRGRLRAIGVSVVMIFTPAVIAESASARLARVTSSPK
jgi:hypothetical protein